MAATAPSAAGDLQLQRFWVPGKAYLYSMQEERTASPATDDKPITITGDVAITAEAVDHGATLTGWTTSGIVVTPDAEPVRRNIPVLADSTLFDPDLTLRIAIDAEGKRAAVTNVEDVGAAMRRGFQANGAAPAEAFFAKVTSREAIEGAVAKHQLAIARTSRLTGLPAKAEVLPVTLPGSSLEVGSETYEILPDAREGRLVHGRWSRVVRKDPANEATRQLLKQMGAPPGEVPFMESDFVEQVDVYFDRQTGELERATHSITASFGGTPTVNRYTLERTAADGGN